MNVSRFVQRTLAFFILIGLGITVLWFAAVKPTINWWGELGFKALLIPIVVIALIYLFASLYEWAKYILLEQGDLDDDGSISFTEWLIMTQEYFGDLRSVRDALNKVIDEDDPTEVKPSDAPKAEK